MNPVSRNILSAIFGAVAATTGTLAQSPVTTAFTYQGVLKEAGAPADGLYDIRFRLFDASLAGSQIGSTICHDSVMPVDGAFTVSLDFGVSAFDGQARWLEIAVRADSNPVNCSAGSYTVLATRQPLTAVPYAIYALDGPGQAGFWAASGTAISNTNTGFVGIRRSAPVSGAEYFGIQAPVVSGYGGMYIRTDGATGLPFYGYKAGPTGESAWTYLDGPTGDWRVNVDGDRIVVTDTGLVGIGTLTPTSKLTVFNNFLANPGIEIALGAASSPALGVSNAEETLQIGLNSINTDGNGFFGDPLLLNNNTSNNVIIAGGGGHCGIGTGVAGLPVVELQVDGGDDASLTSVSGGYFVIGATTGANLVFDNNEFMARNNGIQSPIYINHDGGDVNFGQGGGTCVVRVPILEITGADIAEKFPVSGSKEVLKPGMVMEIDPTATGSLRVSTGAYNRRVAGVISGAGDIPVGAILGNLPGSADSPPIALSGRVHVLCDTTSGPIEPGDLLTTSDIPGHAMKVTDYARAQGAIIGKAMSPLAAGKQDTVIVLVSLQ